MATDVSICNLALSYLGDDASVASIRPPDGSAQAQMCATFYPAAVSAMLELFDWSFAIKRVQVAAYATKFTAGWKYVYQIPSDAIRVVGVSRGDESSLELPPSWRMSAAGHAPKFVVSGRLLYTNIEKPIVSYVSSVVPEQSFSPTFTVALAYYLASMIAGARIKGKEGQMLAKDIDQRFQAALSAAKTRDANQQRKWVEYVPHWIEVR